MTVKIQQYSSNYKKRKLESYRNEKIKKVKHEYSLNHNIPLNIQVSISTLTDTSIPATICLVGQGEPLSSFHLRFKIVFIRFHYY